MCSIDTSILQDGETLDTILDGRLKIIQPQEGYRFSMDSLLLAGLTRVRPQDRVVDLGTGCGIIPLLLVLQRPPDCTTGIEIQQSLVSMARRNVQINGLSRLIRIVHADLRALTGDMVEDPVSLVVSNPPYRELGSGRLNPQVGKAVARHELLANLRDVVRAAAQLLPLKGRLALIYPARRLPHLLAEITREGFAPRCLTLIHTTLDSSARLAHLESVKGGGEQLLVRKPFVVYQSEGIHTPEMAAMHGGNTSVFAVNP
jgi:tRNA1Val (adenine37-N6)-methyltransferase